MKRGQRAAQDPKHGPWKLAGVMASDTGGVDAIYHRTVQTMGADGLWRMTTETQARMLSSVIMREGNSLELDLYQGCEHALINISNRLKLIACRKLGETLK